LTVVFSFLRFWRFVVERLRLSAADAEVDKSFRSHNNKNNSETYIPLTLPVNDFKDRFLFGSSGISQIRITHLCKYVLSAHGATSRKVLSILLY
jgi:hypothetical protein